MIKIKIKTLDQRPGPTRPEDSGGKYRRRMHLLALIYQTSVRQKKCVKWTYANFNVELGIYQFVSAGCDEISRQV